MTENEQHLRWLSIAHYVLGVISLLFTLIVAATVALFTVTVLRPEMFGHRPGVNPPPPGFFAISIGIAGLSLLFQLGTVVGTFLAARWLAARSHYIFCFIVAAFNCIHFPFGSAVGIFTIIVLSRPDVKAMFASATAGVQPGVPSPPLGE